MKAAVIMKSNFNSAHRLNIPSWTIKKNKEFFGICNNPNFHGHNYELEVKVIGEIDKETGIVVELKWLNEIIQKKIKSVEFLSLLHGRRVPPRPLGPPRERVSVSPNIYI